MRLKHSVFKYDKTFKFIILNSIYCTYKALFVTVIYSYLLWHLTWVYYYLKHLITISSHTHKLSDFLMIQDRGWNKNYQHAKCDSISIDLMICIYSCNNTWYIVLNCTVSNFRLERQTIFTGDLSLSLQNSVATLNDRYNYVSADYTKRKY